MIEPLVNGDNLTLQDARKKYDEVERAFAEVKGNYSLSDRLLRRDMQQKDVDILVRCIDILSPLARLPAVETEFHRRTPYNATLHSRIESLNSQISSYSARFKNAGEIALARNPGAAI
ncbi:MAG: hypothetical protein AABW82_05225 [Nanoarchaeota archaeon]